MDREQVSFGKCIDNKAFVRLSMSIKDFSRTEKSQRTIRSSLHQRQIPKPKSQMESGSISHKQLPKFKGFNDEYNAENFQEVDDEGLRPHVSLGTANTRDTPIKKGALAHKNSITQIELLQGKLKSTYTTQVPNASSHGDSKSQLSASRQEFSEDSEVLP